MRWKIGLICNYENLLMRITKQGKLDERYKGAAQGNIITTILAGICLGSIWLGTYLYDLVVSYNQNDEVVYPYEIEKVDRNTSFDYTIYMDTIIELPIWLSYTIIILFLLLIGAIFRAIKNHQKASNKKIDKTILSSYSFKEELDKSSPSVNREFVIEAEITDSIYASKLLFLSKYNHAKTEQKAIEMSIKAAVQHNSLYSTTTLLSKRKMVRVHWGLLLQEMSKKYKYRNVDSTVYQQDIIELKNKMNSKFGQYFKSEKHPKFGYNPGFRISHAQKSLGVYLKHLWCIGKIHTPPQCPVDAIILKKAGMRYPDTKWTHIDTIEEHSIKVDLLNAVAGDISLAEWELKMFN